MVVDPDKIDELFSSLFEAFEKLDNKDKEHYLIKINEKVSQINPEDKLHKESLNTLYKSYVYASLAEKHDLQKNLNVDYFTSIHSDRIDKLSELSPKHSSDALLILSWAGSIKDQKLHQVTDLNPILFNLLNLNDCKHTDCKHSYNIGLTRFSIESLLSCLIGNHGEQNLLQKIITTTTNIIKSYESNFSSITIDSQSFGLWKNTFLNNDDSSSLIHLFGEYLRNEKLKLGRKVILGFRIDVLEGIPFKVKSESKSRWFDPFVVFHFSTDKKKIIGVQGVFVPVHLRNEEVSKRYKSSVQNIIAKIMSKNLSHCDGSHVMVDFESNFNEPLFVLEPSYENLRLTKDKIIEINRGIEVKSTDFNNQFKFYNQHLRNTMELVADVSGKLGMQSNYEYDFSLILTELNEHYFSTFRESKTELQSRFLGTGLNDGEAHSIISFDSKKKYKVLFPGGENGKTAFLSILKNIFRNLKKHSSESKHKINSKELDYYELNIAINEATDELKDDYFIISVTEQSCTYKDYEIDENYKKASDRVKTINKHLIEDKIIKENGQVKQDGWGLLEIRICSAYLIGLPLDEYEHHTSKNSFKDEVTGRLFPTEFVYADMVSDGNGDYQIRHNFYLRKPKFATIWKDENSRIEKVQKQKLIDNGFIIKTKNKDKNNYTSPTEFVIGAHGYEDTGKHHNFKVINCNECFDFDNLSSDELKNLVSKKWQEYIYNKVEAMFKIVKEDEIFLHSLTDSDIIAFSDAESKNLAILDDHLNWLKKVNIQKGNDKNKTLNFFEEFAYYEPTFSDIESEVSFQNSTKLQKIEVIQTKVSIWDERLGDYLKTTQQKEAPDGFTKKDIYSLKGIYTPSGDLQDYFYNEKAEGDKNKLVITLEDLKKDLKNEFNRFDYVVLHFSGFENIVGRTYTKDGNPYSLENAYEELLLHLEIKKTSQYLVFTSGKGIPATLPDRSYFISFTTLEGLIKNKPKYDLICTLNSLRLINNKLYEK